MLFKASKNSLEIVDLNNILTSKLTFGPKHSNIFCFVVNSVTSGEGPEVYAEMLTKNMTPYVTTQVNIILEFNKT